MTDWPTDSPDGSFHYVRDADGGEYILQFFGGGSPRWLFPGGDDPVHTNELRKEGIVEYLGPVPPFRG